MIKDFFKEGLRFECTMCGYCCKGEGVVFVKGEELIKISEYLKESIETVKEKYVSRKVENGYWLKDHIFNGEKTCIFFYDRCVIYPVRPTQCRTYPFWPSILKSEASWENEKKYCPGIGRGKWYSYEEILTVLHDYLENTR